MKLVKLSAVSRTRAVVAPATETRGSLDGVAGIGMRIAAERAEACPSARLRIGLGCLLFGFRARVGGFDDGGDAATGAEVANDLGPDRVAGFDDVVEDLVDDVFLEDAQIAIGEEILLEALELEALLAGHVADGET